MAAAKRKPMKPARLRDPRTGRYMARTEAAAPDVVSPGVAVFTPELSVKPEPPCNVIVRDCDLETTAPDHSDPEVSIVRGTIGWLLLFAAFACLVIGCLRCALYLFGGQ